MKVNYIYSPETQELIDSAKKALREYEYFYINKIKEKYNVSGRSLTLSEEEATQYHYDIRMYQDDPHRKKLRELISGSLLIPTRIEIVHEEGE